MSQGKWGTNGEETLQETMEKHDTDLTSIYTVALEQNHTWEIHFLRLQNFGISIFKLLAFLVNLFKF